MKFIILASLAVVGLAIDDSIFDYSKKTYSVSPRSLALSRQLFTYSHSQVGEWQPPAPPAHESSGLSGKVPIPSDVQNAGFQFKFSEQNANVAFKGGARKLMMAGAEAMGKKVPHNWFGQGKYQAPAYEIATGEEECDVCQAMIENAVDTVEVDAFEGAEGAEAGGKKDLCVEMDPEYKDMCKGYQKYLEDCPSFVHNICHQDMGGSERLRAPCPDHLICYYCLRINPLYCMEED
jgi:hypothetical protein